MAKRKAKKLSAQEEGVMRILVLNSGSKYMDKIRQHIDDAGVENEAGNHKISTVTPEKFYKRMNRNEKRMADYVGNFDYILSNGSSKYRKYDTDIHRFIAKHKKKNAVLAGICHGAQQTAVAHGAELRKTEYMHRGKRKSKLKSYHNALRGVADEGEMTTSGYHQWYIPSNKAGSKLEVIAEAESPHTGEKFVEFYKVRGENIFGAQFHPELDDGKVIKNLYKKAYDSKSEPKTVKKIKIGPRKAKEALEYAKAA